jgi:hypothetical protein
MTKNDKLIAIIKVIDESCKSSVKRFESGKHTGLSVGITAYEERQNTLTNLGLNSILNLKYKLLKSSPPLATH